MVPIHDYMKGTREVSVFSNSQKCPKDNHRQSPVLTNRLVLPQWAPGHVSGSRGWGQGGTQKVQQHQGSAPLETSPKGLVEICLA